MGKNTNNYGDAFRKARLKRGLTRAELAEKVDISDRYLQKIENENKMPTYKVLKKIINILAIDANVFFYDDIDSGSDMYDHICRKLKSCNQYELNIINETLNAILDKDKWEK